MHRNLIRHFNAPEDGAAGGGAGTSENGSQDGTPEPTQTFTQADVDRIVKERIQRVKTQFADYDDLKTKAEGAKTLEDRLAELETKASQSDQRALRAEIAAEYSISTKKGPKGEPSDADLFLTGTDQESLTAQAKRLMQREADRKKQGNVAPKEGDNPDPSNSSGDMREFTRQLFDKAD